MRNVSDKIVEKIKTQILSSMTFFFENHVVNEIKWKNIVEPDRPQMENMAHAHGFWIPKATNTHSK